MRKIQYRVLFRERARVSPPLKNNARGRRVKLFAARRAIAFAPDTHRAFILFVLRTSVCADGLNDEMK